MHAPYVFTRRKYFALSNCYKFKGNKLQSKWRRDCTNIAKHLHPYMVRANRPPDKSAYWKTFFFIAHPKHVVGTQKKRLNETVLSST